MKIDMGDDVALKSIMSEAILRSLDDAKRETIIRGAIEHLMTPQVDQYNRGTRASPLEQAFRNAIELEASRYARDRVASDPAVQTMIARLFTEALARAESDDTRAKIVDGMVTALARAFEAPL